MGAWIEIFGDLGKESWNDVAPLVGAWIEIPTVFERYTVNMSLPSWERGLKCIARREEKSLKVAPLVGAWIEM